jgi:hypothetical protein
MRKMIIKILKPIFSDARQAIIGVIVLALLGGTTGVLYRSKTALAFSIAILTTPTPLWATIVLVLLILAYIKTKSIHSSKTPKLLRAYGAYWDAKYDMYCLSCNKPLKNSSSDKPSVFYCSDERNCNSKHILKDDDGNELSKQDTINKIKTSS